MSTKSEPVITEVDFLRTASGFPASVEVVATLSDDTQVSLFEYYADELSFTPEELVGRTVDDARHLRHKRDVEWLRSN